MVIDNFFSTQKEIVIFDTEFTSWEGAIERKWSGENEYKELVQIAAQKINLETNMVLGSFEMFVKPKINNTLSQYFINLTHITQNEVDAKGVGFLEAYENFMAWAGGLSIYSFSQILESRSDRGVLEDNVALYELDIEVPVKQFGTLTALFQAAGVDTSAYTSGELHRAFDISLSGQVHNAMHDVDSLVASLFAVKKGLTATK